VRSRALISALLVAATLLAFFEVREHSFVDYDDIMLIIWNEDLRVASLGEAFRVAFTTTSHVNWTPLTLLSLQANHALHGLEPAGYLITNVALHAASAVILFLALVRLTGGIWASAFVAGVFALHPLHVESVAWAALRKDPLSALFWMLTLLAYARYTERLGAGRYAWVALFLTLGLLAKPVVVTLPCVLLPERFRIRRSSPSIYASGTLSTPTPCISARPSGPAGSPSSTRIPWTRCPPRA